jgi:hypothetical protein
MLDGESYRVIVQHPRVTQNKKALVRVLDSDDRIIGESTRCSLVSDALTEAFTPAMTQIARRFV